MGHVRKHATNVQRFASLIVVLWISLPPAVVAKSAPALRGYYLIGLSQASGDWRVLGQFDIEQDAFEALKQGGSIDKRYALLTLDIVDASEPKAIPLLEGTARLTLSAQEYRGDRVLEAMPSIYKSKLVDDMRRSLEPDARTVLERIELLQQLGEPKQDEDGDGLIDSEEDLLADKFAPIVFHTKNEPNLPANVDWFLSKTSLRFRDVRQQIDELILEQLLTPSDLLFVRRKEGWPGLSPPKDIRWSLRHNLVYVDSSDSCDRAKEKTFYLTDVAAEHRQGCVDAKGWVTYTFTRMTWEE
jgi:hypothetical protein